MRRWFRRFCGKLLRGRRSKRGCFQSRFELWAAARRLVGLLLGGGLRNGFSRIRLLVLEPARTSDWLRLGLWRWLLLRFLLLFNLLLSILILGCGRFLFLNVIGCRWSWLSFLQSSSHASQLLTALNGLSLAQIPRIRSHADSRISFVRLCSPGCSHWEV